MSAQPRQKKMKSLADYIVRFDLATTLEEARFDYSPAEARAPRLLTQTDIAARFRKRRPATKGRNE